MKTALLPSAIRLSKLGSGIILSLMILLPTAVIHADTISSLVQFNPPPSGAVLATPEIIQANGSYYLIGASLTGAEEDWSGGIVCYSNALAGHLDTAGWTNPQVIVSYQDLPYHWLGIPGTTRHAAYRAKVFPTTAGWALWMLHFNQADWNSRKHDWEVFTLADPAHNNPCTGPYQRQTKEINEGLLRYHGDFGIFTEGGTSYIVYSEEFDPDHPIYYAAIAPDGLSMGTPVFIANGTNALEDIAGVESPELFKLNGQYFLTASQMNGDKSSWHVYWNLHGTPDTTLTADNPPAWLSQETNPSNCGSQQSHVLVTNPDHTTALLIGDMWGRQDFGPPEGNWGCFNSAGDGCGDPDFPCTCNFSAPPSPDQSSGLQSVFAVLTASGSSLSLRCHQRFAHSSTDYTFIP